MYRCQRKSAMKQQSILLTLFAVPLFTVVEGCIGTDYIQDPPSTFEPRIEITGDAQALRVGETLSLRASYYDESGEETSAIFTWISSDPAIASLDETGLVTAHQPGQVMINASVFDLSSDPFLLTVVEDMNSVAQVTITPETVTMRPGDSVVLSAVATSIGGDVVTPTRLTWLSSDEGVATVDQLGLVHAISAGTVDIVAEADGVSSNPVTIQVEPEQLTRMGTFQKNPGTSYQVEGSALLEENGSGGIRLRFGDDFSCSRGPKLHVYLSKSNRIGGNSRDLGPLQSTSGAQSYDIPSGIAIDEFRYILIHCVPFNVTFGFAELTK